MKTFFYIISLFVLIWIASCNSSGCLENRNAVPYAGFYASETGAAISLMTVEIYGLGMSSDNPLSEAGVAISNIYLPMRSSQQSTGWVFAYKQEGIDSTYNDTIVFNYTSAPRFASEECGVIYDYHITSFTYTTHLMDSVVVTDSLITNIDQERIKIYFRTQYDDETGEDNDMRSSGADAGEGENNEDK